MKLSDFLFVREGICLFCREEETWGDILCPDCHRQLEPHGGTFLFDGERRCRIAYFYNRFLQEIFRRYKFREQAELAKPLGQLLANDLAAAPAGAFTCIVPVPMHPKARKRRGYDQVRLLADTLQEQTGLPVIEGLVKTRDTKEQNKLSRTERAHNLAGAFSLRRGAELSGHRVLLLDDLVTTGNTLKTAAAALDAAGPESVTGLAFAAPRFYEPLPLQNSGLLW